MMILIVGSDTGEKTHEYMRSELDDTDGTSDFSFWDHLIHPRPFILGFLILFGIILQLNIHYNNNLSAAYTQFFFIIIVLAGLWYQKKAICIAIFFSILYLGMEFISPVSLSLDSIFRVLMLCLVSVIIGYMTERMMILQKRLHNQNKKLQFSYEALTLGNKKLNMLSSITRHDILNQVQVLKIVLDLSKEEEKDLKIKNYLEKGEIAAEAIQNQISFTRFYQDIGVDAPSWQNMEELIRASTVELRIIDIQVDIAFSRLEVYADPLINKVIYNLMENSLRHGGAITLMSFSFEKTVTDGVFIYQDDGVGISDDDRRHLFERGFGKHTGLGLFLSREILSITGISIQETGKAEQGVRFEIHIPPDKYRLPG